jgi:hypothetical protein
VTPLNLIFSRYKSKISARPLISGSGTLMTLSKRPARLTAGSIAFYRFVAPITIIFYVSLNPSISASN